VAIITFSDAFLALEAVSNQFNKQFKGRNLVAEACKSDSMVIRKILDSFSTSTSNNGS
jgi:hypothetical protein